MTAIKKDTGSMQENTVNHNHLIELPLKAFHEQEAEIDVFWVGCLRRKPARPRTRAITRWPISVLIDTCLDHP